MRHSTFVFGAFLLLAAIVPLENVSAQSAEEFYKKTTVTLAAGTGVGGSHDLNARLMARHIGKHLPGNPTVVVQNVPGAGGLTLANHLAAGAPQDGSYIAMVNRVTVFDSLYFKKSAATFDPLKINWLGSPDGIVSVSYAWHTAKVKTAKDLQSMELTVGGSGGGSDKAFLFMNQVAGFKFKLIPGYKSGAEIDLAMERGEIDGGSIAWAGMKSRNQEWLDKKLVNLTFQIGLQKHPDIPEVPLVLEFAKSPEDRALMELFFAAEEIGYPFMAPPGVPADRLAVLRTAFDNTLKDPAYAADLKQAALDLNPVSWQRTTKIINDAFSAPAALRTRLQDALENPAR
jgi:tripartite-type tricarboxylate transporter receptor subunit TctC